MSEYVPQVGDRVKLAHWRNCDMTVSYVGAEYVVGAFPDGSEKVGHRDEAWVKVPPFPERWINVYEAWTAEASSLDEADEMDATTYSDHFRLGVIHLHPDGTLTMEEP